MGNNAALRFPKREIRNWSIAIIETLKNQYEINKYINIGCFKKMALQILISDYIQVLKKKIDEAKVASGILIFIMSEFSVLAQP